MAQNKTVPTTAKVSDFLATLSSDQRRACETVAKIMRKATGTRAKIWGSSIVGFGEYHYVYDSGREGDSPLAGYSPRKANLAVYVMDGFDNKKTLLKKLGPHKVGKTCLYIKRIEDIDLVVLNKIIHLSVAAMRKRYPQA